MDKKVDQVIVLLNKILNDRDERESINEDEV